MNFDVFFYEAFDEEQEAIASRLGTAFTAGYSSETIQRSGHTHPPAPLISIRTQSSIPETWHSVVEGILARTTGYDHLLPLVAGNSPLQAAHLPEYCTRAVAEQAALLWMALLRKLPQQLASWPRFKRDALTGGENLERSLLVVGVGRIGHEITRIGKGLGMRVRGADPVQRHPDVEYTPLAEGIATSDVVVAAMNLTSENRGLFNYDLLRHAKPGCLFVNVARGELVRSADIARLLDEGTLGGAAFDVYNDETIVADALRSGSAQPEADLLRALAGRSNVMLTPHNAFNTTEALARKADLTVEQTLHFLKHRQFRWPLTAKN